MQDETIARLLAASIADSIAHIRELWGNVPAILVADVLVASGIDALVRVHGPLEAAERLQEKANQIVQEQMPDSQLLSWAAMSRAPLRISAGRL